MFKSFQEKERTSSYMQGLPGLWDQVGIVFLDYINIITLGGEMHSCNQPKRHRSFTHFQQTASCLQCFPSHLQVLYSSVGENHEFFPWKAQIWKSQCSPAMTLLPYDTRQEEKISNFFLERLKYEKARVPLQWPFCCFTPTFLSSSLFSWGLKKNAYTLS